MGYTVDGYIPDSFETLMGLVVSGINTQYGTTYTQETFTGTNFYKFAYVQVQNVMALQTQLAETYSKLQDYIALSNEKILEPIVTNTGLIQAFATLGYKISIKEPTALTAGELSICVDADSGAVDWLTQKANILQLIADSTSAGEYTNGAQTGAVVLSNGQAKTFRFALPTETAMILRLTIVISENNRYTIDDSDTIKAKLLANIAANYALGLNFEPLKYFCIAGDAPYASSAVLEYSINDGANWFTAIIDADYDDLYTIAGAGAITVSIS